MNVRRMEHLEQEITPFGLFASVVLLCSRFTGISSAQNLTVDRRVHSLLFHIVFFFASFYLIVCTQIIFVSSF